MATNGTEYERFTKRVRRENDDGLNVFNERRVTAVFAKDRVVIRLDSGTLPGIEGDETAVKRAVSGPDVINCDHFKNAIQKHT